MATELPFQRLHDKATRGEPLSPEEQAALQEAYVREDRSEAAVLEASAPCHDHAPLRSQIESAMNRLLAVSESIRRQETENEAVRREIGALQRKLPQPCTQAV